MEDEWDLTFTDQDLQAIDAICESFTKSSSSSSSSTFSPSERPLTSSSAGDDTHRNSRRRLPDSLFLFQRQLPASSSLSPCRKTRRFSHPYFQGDSVPRYPELEFKGQVMYSRTAEEVEKAAEEILSFVEAERRNKDNKFVIGFDIEWRPTFRRGVAPGKAAVMQICSDNRRCYVMHIIHSRIPQKLQCLLEDPTVVKVGVCIANDAYKIFQDYNISVASVEDLSNLANQKLGGPPRKWSLASLTESLICKQLPKPHQIRLGNWEVSVLSRGQLQYAATDAFVSWYLYQVLTGLPEDVDNKTEEKREVQ